MTSYTDQRTTSATWPLFATLGAGISIVLTAMGTFWDLTDNETGSPDGLSEFLPVVGMIAVATAVVFGLFVRTATPQHAGRRAVILAVLGFVSLVAFWSGLPMVLSAGAVCCALMQRSGASRAAIAISVVTFGLAVLAAVAG